MAPPQFRVSAAARLHCRPATAPTALPRRPRTSADGTLRTPVGKATVAQVPAQRFASSRWLSAAEQAPDARSLSPPRWQSAAATTIASAPPLPRPPLRSTSPGELLFVGGSGVYPVGARVGAVRQRSASPTPVPVAPPSRLISSAASGARLRSGSPVPSRTAAAWVVPEVSDARVPMKRRSDMDSPAPPFRGIGSATAPIGHAKGYNTSGSVPSNGGHRSAHHVPLLAALTAAAVGPYDNWRNGSSISSAASSVFSPNAASPRSQASMGYLGGSLLIQVSGSEPPPPVTMASAVERSFTPGPMPGMCSPRGGGGDGRLSPRRSAPAGLISSPSTRWAMPRGQSRSVPELRPLPPSAPPPTFPPPVSRMSPLSRLISGPTLRERIEDRVLHAAPLLPGLAPGLSQPAPMPGLRSGPAPGPLPAEEKLRRWLSTIPISEPGRTWDDGQISQIALFARENSVDHLSAEDIYGRFVDHTVYLAELDLADESEAVVGSP